MTSLMPPGSKGIAASVSPQLTPPGSLSSQQTPAGQPEFVSLNPAYICTLCNSVLHDAMQTPCGHRLCQMCLENYLQENNSRICPYEEDGCEIIKKDQVNKDSRARREIRRLMVYCSNKSDGCNVTTEWKDLEKHEADCMFGTINCPNNSFGCTESVIKQQLNAHLDVCPYMPTTCQYCKEVLAKDHLEEHERVNCPEFPVSCEFECDIKPLPRQQMQDHNRVCPKRPRACKYASMGCEFQGLGSEVAKHEQEDTEAHLQQITMHMANLDLHSLDMKKEIQLIESSRRKMQSEVQEIKEKIRNIKEDAKRLKKLTRDEKVAVVDLTERIIHVEKTVENIAQKILYEKVASDVSICKENMKSLSERIRSLQKTDHPPEERNSATTSIPRTQTLSELQQQSKQLGLQDVRLAELDLRFQVLETVNYDGMLLWKINRYQQRKQEAKSGKTVSLYSPPFFTSRYGYKMCARVYLNGDGMGKGSYFSIFFVVMQSEYDALLPWPFRQKVTFMVLDQDGTRQNLTDSFKPDPSSSSFKRPTSEMNIASGCPLFVSQSVLERGTKYVKDDTIYVKVTVDTNGLNPL